MSTPKLKLYSKVYHIDNPTTVLFITKIDPDTPNLVGVSISKNLITRWVPLSTLTPV